MFCNTGSSRGGQQFLGMLEQGDLAQVHFILGWAESSCLSRCAACPRIDRQTRYPELCEFPQGVLQGILGSFSNPYMVSTLTLPMISTASRNSRQCFVNGVIAIHGRQHLPRRASGCRKLKRVTAEFSSAARSVAGQGAGAASMVISAHAVRLKWLVQSVEQALRCRCRAWWACRRRDRSIRTAAVNGAWSWPFAQADTRHMVADCSMPAPAIPCSSRKLPQGFAERYMQINAVAFGITEAARTVR